jgi:hypothetical protein
MVIARFGLVLFALLSALLTSGAIAAQSITPLGEFCFSLIDLFPPSVDGNPQLETRTLRTEILDLGSDMFAIHASVLDTTQVDNTPRNIRFVATGTVVQTDSSTLEGGLKGVEVGPNLSTRDYTASFQLNLTGTYLDSQGQFGNDLMGMTQIPCSE